MIPLETIQSLTEDELAFVLFVVNKIKPCLPNTEINKNILPYFKYDFLARTIVSCKDSVSDEGQEIFKNVCKKLSIAI